MSPGETFYFKDGKAPDQTLKYLHLLHQLPSLLSVPRKSVFFFNQYFYMDKSPESRVRQLRYNKVTFIL